jgi:uncharacterized protein (TIGR02598 family)
MSGFSLVEVVIALGVVAFAIISMLGLLFLGIKDSRESQEKTIASMIQRDATVRIREVWQYLDTQPLPPVGANSYTHTFFYSSGGLYLGDNFSTLPASPVALYAAKVKLSNMDASNYPVAISSATGQLASLTVTIQWPLGAGGIPIGTLNSFSFVTLVAKNSDTAWPAPPTAVTRP